MTKDKSIVQLKPKQLSSTEFSRQSLTVIASPGQTIEEIMEPKAWATLAPSVNTWDKIDVIAEDGAYTAELFVVQSSKLWVRTALVRMTRLDGDEEKAEEKKADEVDAPYFAKFRGPVNKWCVVRREDDSNVSTGNLSREDATKMMVEYEKALTL